MTAYMSATGLEFRRVLFRSRGPLVQVAQGRQAIAGERQFLGPLLLIVDSGQAGEIRRRPAAGIEGNQVASQEIGRASCRESVKQPERALTLHYKRLTTSHSH